MLKFTTLLNTKAVRRPRRDDDSADQPESLPNDRWQVAGTFAQCDSDASDRARRELDEQVQRLSELLDRVDSIEFDREADEAEIFSIPADAAPAIAKDLLGSACCDENAELTDDRSCDRDALQITPFDAGTKPESCPESPAAIDEAAGDAETPSTLASSCEAVAGVQPPQPQATEVPATTDAFGTVGMEILAEVPAFPTQLVGYPVEPATASKSVHMMIVQAACTDDVAARRPRPAPPAGTRLSRPFGPFTTVGPSANRFRQAGLNFTGTDGVARSAIGPSTSPRTNSLALNFFAVIGGLVTLLAIWYIATDTSTLF